MRASPRATELRRNPYPRKRSSQRREGIPFCARAPISPRSFGKAVAADGIFPSRLFESCAFLSLPPRHKCARAADPTRQSAEAAWSAPEGRVGWAAVLSSAPNPVLARYKDLSPREDLASSWAAFVFLLSTGHNGPPASLSAAGRRQYFVASPPLPATEPSALPSSRPTCSVCLLAWLCAPEDFERRLREPASGWDRCELVGCWNLGPSHRRLLTVQLSG